MQVRIDQVTPDVVTTTSDPVVTVSGTVTNIGDRPVRDVMVRLEHAGTVTSSAALRTSLDGSTDQYQPAADFVTVAPELQRGQGAGFTLSAPLRSLTKPSLTIDQPGIFPILVNVNGTPDYGAPARLDNARFLLPVVGVPPDKSDRATGFDTAVAPETTKPVWITMLWPLADRPAWPPVSRAAPFRCGSSTTTWPTRWPTAADSTPCSPQPSSPPAATSTPRAPSPAPCVWRSIRICWSPSTR
ncbi:collagen alpha-2 domain protein [Mycobacterium kansasii]|uniref:Collagen alpha-2 domain protein n=1 Tax=Mycobacterium kansasii TaxID=1768 RepID=A0A1V3WW12_MYCKA|nr:collagen alpha-2 domain protein [Mycobacterium kansasii]